MGQKRDLYTEMHTKYYSLMYSVIFTKVNNEHDARDICQNIFMKLYEKIHEINNYRKWLYGAIRMEISNFYQKKDHQNINIDDMLKDVTMTYFNGFRDTRIIINDAINNEDVFLKDNDKILFDLIALYNFSYSKVAEELGLTKRKVEYQYNKISEKILDILKQNGIKNIEDIL